MVSRRHNKNSSLGSYWNINLKTYVDGLWLCFRDFNAILHSLEKQSTRQPHPA